MNGLDTVVEDAMGKMKTPSVLLSEALVLVAGCAGLAACGPPPRLTVSPTSAIVTGKFGSDTEPPKAMALKLASDQPDQSVGWTASSPAEWVTLSSATGGTPADLNLTIDHEKLKYGENEVSLRFESKQGSVDVPVRFTALGCLRIGPTQAVTLEGDAGEPSSATVALTVDSPGKAGLRWTVATDDPWLKVTPSGGVTPAQVTISADLTKAADNLSGRLTFQADATWKGSPTVVPVALRLLNPAAVRKQVDAKVQLIKSEIERFKADLQERFVASLKTPEPQSLISALERVRSDSKANIGRIGTMMDDLTGFLDQNGAYETKLGFAETRAWMEKTRKDGAASVEKLERAVGGIKDLKVKVDSRSDWKEIGATARKGDLIGISASGEWTLGTFVGKCGPGGFAGDELDRLSIDGQYTHGSLLLRAGKAVIVAGVVSGLVRIENEGGELTVRVNDKNLTDNSGFLSLRVVVVPLGE